MKENSDLSKLFPTLTIAKDLEEVWQYLCDGKYLVGADLTLYRRPPFVMENAFCLSNGFIRMFKVKWATDSVKIKLYTDQSIGLGGGFTYDIFKIIFGNWMAENFDFFFVDDFGLLDTKDIRPGREFL